MSHKAISVSAIEAEENQSIKNKSLFHSLYSRLVLVLVCVLFVTACCYAAVGYILVQRSTAANHQAIHQPLARTFAGQLAPMLDGPLHLTAVKTLFHSLMLANPNIELYYLDQNSDVLAHTLQTSLLRKHVSMGPIGRLLGGKESYPIYSDDPSTLDEQALFSVAMVPHGFDIDTYIYVVLQSENHAMVESLRLSRHLWSLGLLALFGSLALALVTGLWLFRGLTVRLGRLGQVMEDASVHGFKPAYRYAQQTGDYSEDEIAQLGSRFDQMAERIQIQMHDLQLQESTRRQLLANISHDLRTPLASLRGYIETLQLKDSSLSEELRREFLQIAQRQAMRLQRLIDDMFEAAKLDAEEATLEMEHFSLEELVHDVVIDYRVVAQKANVQLVFEPEQQSCMVKANLAGVQRVLDNLLSNAIRFTPASGCIRLGVRVQIGSVVVVSVHNSGSYISDVESGEIFERFYQSGNSHRSGEHAGLGLAIAVRILELHGRTLELESSREEGTRFYFELPLSA